MNAILLRLSSIEGRRSLGYVAGAQPGGGFVPAGVMLVVVMLALIAGVPSLHAADSAGAPRVSAGETRVRETGVLPQGGLLDRLPLGSELGDSWQRDLDLLIDPESSPETVAVFVRKLTREKAAAEPQPKP